MWTQTALFQGQTHSRLPNLTTSSLMGVHLGVLLILQNYIMLILIPLMIRFESFIVIHLSICTIYAALQTMVTIPRTAPAGSS